MEEKSKIKTTLSSFHTIIKEMLFLFSKEQLLLYNKLINTCLGDIWELNGADILY